MSVHANTKCEVQPAHLCSLIITYVIISVDKIKAKFTICKIFILYFASVAECSIS